MTAKGPRGSKAPRGRKAAAAVAGQARQMTVRVRKTQKSDSSRAWLERQLNDPYVQAARREGWRSRAAYKLIEIDDRWRLLKPGQRVLDLGAAPGGWSQVAAQRVKATASGPRNGQVVAIDYLPFDDIPGVTILEADFTTPDVPGRLRGLLRDGGADVVLSDMAAPTTGHTHTDHLRIMGLAESAYDFAREILSPGGHFLCKVFQGGSEGDLLKTLKLEFATVRHIKPPASRSESAELYVLAMGFRGAAQAPDRQRSEQ